MSEATWTINDRTSYEAAGTVLPAGFTATVNNRTGKIEAKVNVDGPACGPDVESVRRQIVDVALQLTAELPEQQRRRDIEARIAEARAQEKCLEQLRLEYAKAKGERDAFNNYAAPDAGQQLLELGRRVDDLKHQIDAMGDPTAVIFTLTSQLKYITHNIANAAKSTVTQQAIKQVTDQLLTQRAELLRRLEIAIAPVLGELASTDIVYSQIMVNANSMSGTLPRDIEATIKQAVGVDDSYPRISPVPASSAMPSTAAMPASPTNPQRQYGILADGSDQRKVAGVQS